MLQTLFVVDFDKTTIIEQFDKIFFFLHVWVISFWTWIPFGVGDSLDAECLLMATG